MLAVAPGRASLIKNHGTNPAISHKIKGKLATGCDLNPIWNTNQYKTIVIIGCKKAQAVPSAEPAYFALKSSIANCQINTSSFTLFFNTSFIYFCSPSLYKTRSLIFFNPRFHPGVFTSSRMYSSSLLIS